MGRSEMTPYATERFINPTVSPNRWAMTRNEFIFVCGNCYGLDYPDKCGRCGSTNVKVYKLVKHD